MTTTSRYEAALNAALKLQGLMRLPLSAFSVHVCSGGPDYVLRVWLQPNHRNAALALPKMIDGFAVRVEPRPNLEA
jgi:hypothetical protein